MNFVQYVISLATSLEILQIEINIFVNVDLDGPKA